LNTNGFYDHLILMVKTMVREGFLKESNEKMLLVETDFQLLIEDMKNYQAPKIAKWISEKQT
jgi:predicted Rossmann-fold nucleotide-binding protein